MNETISSNNPKMLDFSKIVKAVWHHKILYAKTLTIASVLAIAYILCIPRYYACQITLAPEMTGSQGLSLKSMASLVGISTRTSMAEANDAIYPEIYPSLFKSTKFLTEFFNVKVADEQIKTDYYTYLLKYQKVPWWTGAIGKIKSLFAKEEPQGTGKLNPFKLNKEQTDILHLIGKNIKCSYDKKTSIITIDVEDQSPVIAAKMADTVAVHLQRFITKYRTNKARLDLQYTTKLMGEAKQRYEKARQRYAAFCDANSEVQLQSYITKQNDLENEMQLLYNSYSTLATLYQQAQAKVQECTPAFTTVQNATVPIKPAGPKRMLFVIIVFILAFLATTLFLIKKENII